MGVSTLYKTTEGCDLVIINEIGRVELFSANFRGAILQIINDGKRVLITIILSANP